MNKVTLLPSALVELIQNLPYPTGKYDLKNKSILLIKIIYSNYLKTGNEYLPLSSEYLEKTFGIRYFKVTKFLMENGIIDLYVFNTLKGKKQFSTKNKQCKRYRLNPNICTPINEQTYSKIEYTDHEPPLTDCIYAQYALSDLRQITLDYNKAIEWVNDYVNNISIDGYNTNEAITADVINLTINDKPVFLKRSEAIKKAMQLNKDLIQTKRNTFVIEDIKEFIDKVKKHKLMSYRSQLEKLRFRIFFAKRNQTNYRLDTSLTNLPKQLFQFITVDQEAILSLDLSNSQFALLSHILKTEGNNLGFENFNTITASGELYETTAKLLNITRNEAKNIWFQVAFSSYRFSCLDKQKLKKAFPRIFDWIKKFKKDHGSNEFSIMLQKLESSIFIDKIYKRVKESGYFCLTKHDSLLVKESDHKAIKAIMIEALQNEGIEFDLKLE